MGPLVTEQGAARKRCPVAPADRPRLEQSPRRRQPAVPRLGIRPTTSRPAGTPLLVAIGRRYRRRPIVADRE